MTERKEAEKNGALAQISQHRTEVTEVVDQ